MPIYEEKLISPLAIRFTQQRIRTNFRDGREVEATIKEMVVSPGVGEYDLIIETPFPSIEIMRWGPKGRRSKASGHWYSFDNRRLYCLQRLAAAHWPKRVGAKVEVMYADDGTIRKKLDTQSEGLRVNIGHAFAAPDELVEWSWAAFVQQRAPPGNFALEAKAGIAADDAKTGVHELLDVPSTQSAASRLEMANSGSVVKAHGAEHPPQPPPQPTSIGSDCGSTQSTRLSDAPSSAGQPLSKLIEQLLVLKATEARPVDAPSAVAVEKTSETCSLDSANEIDDASGTCEQPTQKPEAHAVAEQPLNELIEQPAVIKSNDAPTSREPELPPVQSSLNKGLGSKVDDVTNSREPDLLPVQNVLNKEPVNKLDGVGGTPEQAAPPADMSLNKLIEQLLDLKSKDASPVADDSSVVPEILPAAVSSEETFVESAANTEDADAVSGQTALMPDATPPAEESLTTLIGRLLELKPNEKGDLDESSRETATPSPSQVSSDPEGMPLDDAKPQPQVTSTNANLKKTLQQVGAPRPTPPSKTGQQGRVARAAQTARMAQAQFAQAEMARWHMQRAAQMSQWQHAYAQTAYPQPHHAQWRQPFFAF